MSQQQPIKILKIFKDSFACRIGLAANHRYRGNIQRLFRLKKISQQQPIIILKKFKVFFAWKIVLGADHRYLGNIQRLFRLQNCLSRKSAISWQHSKIFPPAKLSQQQPIILLKKFKVFFDCKIVLGADHRYLGNIQRLFRLQNCLSRKSAISWQHSKIFPPAKLSQQQPINILKRFKDFFACKNILAVIYRYPGNIQRLFRVQNVLVATHQNSQNIQRFFRLQNWLSRKSSISWKYSKTFSSAKLSQPQIIDILEIFQDFFGCKFVLAANHLYPGNIQRLFRLQNCLSRKTSIIWKISKTFSPAKLSQQQPIIILKLFKNFSACKIVVAANQRFPGNIQRFFRLQKCLTRKASLSWTYSKTFSAAKMSQQQPIKILKIFKSSFAFKIFFAGKQL